MSSKRDVKKSKEIIQISETARSHEHRRKVAFKKTTVDPNDPNNREVIYLDIHSFDDDVTPIEILLILREFDDAASMLGWTNGPKLFNNFQLLVTGSTLASDEWTKAAAQANTMTVATFTVARQSFLSELMKPIKYTSQIDYLRKLKKPRDMELIEFKRNFETSNKLLAKYPDANGATGLDADEFKRTFYNALPYSWRDKFRITGKREENVTFDEILEHMLAIESVEPSSESGTRRHAVRITVLVIMEIRAIPIKRIPIIPTTTPLETTVAEDVEDVETETTIPIPMVMVAIMDDLLTIVFVLEILALCLAIRATFGISAIRMHMDAMVTIRDALKVELVNRM